MLENFLSALSCLGQVGYWALGSGSWGPSFAAAKDFENFLSVLSCLSQVGHWALGSGSWGPILTAVNDFENFLMTTKYRFFKIFR